MAKVDLRLSSREQDNGKREILIRFYQGKQFNLRAKTGVLINPDYFEYDIDWTKTVNAGVKMPKKAITSTTLSNAEKHGYTLRETGEIVVSEQKVISNIVHNELKAKQETINRLKDFILKCYEEADKEDVKDDWLKTVVDKFFHPEKYMTEEEKMKNRTFFELFDEFLADKNFSNDRARGMQVLKRDVWRYMKFQQEVCKRQDFTFNVNDVTKDDIEDFRDYLESEKTLMARHKRLFKQMIDEQPNGIRKGHSDIEVRGLNTIVTLMKKLRSFFSWCYEKGKTKNRPFDGVKIGSEKYGTPYYISTSERDKIANTKMPTRHLETQRDIFVFHCFVGCRVSDLVKLTKDNITDGVLIYTPHKTKDDGEQAVQARVPLHPKAIELINKYKGKDKKDRLFPFISAIKYNVAIKEIFTLAGITRKVEVRNAKSGEMELRPINELASSHIARRTFVGNAYKQVADPNIIGKMSGHVEGSKAFARYRDIDDETLKDVISKIG